jgi:DNA mismatch repair protein MLH1
MSCRKATGGGTADINTITGASVLDNIGLQYGEGVKRELSEIKVESEELKVQIRAWCSGANYQGKKGTYLFFINSASSSFPFYTSFSCSISPLADRYVDCTPLKRALESFYATILAKGTYPFVYLSLDIDPTKVDVNVHPTKKEVGFEDEDEIVELVCEKLGETLEKQGGSRSFKVQVRSRLSVVCLFRAHLLLFVDAASVSQHS